MMVSPMPRIDGGLEIVCGDGELAARLQRAVRALTSELSVRVRGELIEQQIEGVLGGVLDSGEKLAVLGCESAGGEGANRWYAISARGASGKDVRQLFERQGAIVSRVLRTRLGTARAGALARARTLPRADARGGAGAAVGRIRGHRSAHPNLNLNPTAAPPPRLAPPARRASSPRPRSRLMRRPRAAARARPAAMPARRARPRRGARGRSVGWKAGVS